MANKAEIQHQLESQMRELQSQIEQLSTKMEQAGTEAQSELQRTMDDLKVRNEKAESQLNELRAASDEVLKTLAGDIETYWSAFTGAVNNVFIEPNKTNTEQTSGTSAQTDTPSASDVHDGASTPTDSNA